MRHKKVSRRFSRSSSHRIAMMRNLAISLIEHEIIKTTVEKAKELRRFLEPLITKSKSDNLHTRRVVLSKLASKQAVKKLFNDLGPRFVDVNGGYLRIIKAGFRAGDKADVCYVELTKRVEVAENPEEVVNDVEQVEDASKIVSPKTTEDESVAKQETLKKEDTKKEAPKKEATKKEAPKKEAPKKEAIKKEATKKEAPKKEVTKKETPKKEVTKKEKPKENWWSRFFK